ncbi:MAG: hypothetical protein M1818_001951 [Claussenomyces sp. TS43310]|nr:MAG: hypothetical protein M1818_001951 [Claussenomyces sp. TS43310]
MNGWSRSEASPNLQAVRLKRRWIRPGSIVVGTVTLVVCYTLLNRVLLSPLDRIADDLENSLDERTKKELDEEEIEPLFIPFPGTTRQVKPRPYRGNDPEWQEFIKFSKDPTLGKRVRDELAEIAKRTCEKSPALTYRCGKDIKVRRHWLDIDFPQSPPPEFERSGIEWADDYVAWTTMPVDSKTVFRIRNVLWPSAVAQSSWSFSKVLFTQNKDKLAEMLGIKPKEEPFPDIYLGKRMKPPVAGLGKPEDISGEALPPAASRGFGPSKKPDDGDDLVAKSSPTPLDGSGKVADQSQSTVDLQKAHASLIGMKMHLVRAMLAFRLKLAQTWKPARGYPPRGSIIVSGLVELDTPKAWLVVDVKAAWDPKEKVFAGESTRLALRRMQMKKQAPLGGV